MTCNITEKDRLYGPHAVHLSLLSYASNHVYGHLQSTIKTWTLSTTVCPGLKVCNCLLVEVSEVPKPTQMSNFKAEHLVNGPKCNSKPSSGPDAIHTLSQTRLSGWAKQRRGKKRGWFRSWLLGLREDDIVTGDESSGSTPVLYNEKRFLLPLAKAAQPMVTVQTVDKTCWERYCHTESLSDCPSDTWV